MELVFKVVVILAVIFALGAVVLGLGLLKVMGDVRKTLLDWRASWTTETGQVSRTLTDIKSLILRRNNYNGNYDRSRDRNRNYDRNSNGNYRNNYPNTGTAEYRPRNFGGSPRDESDT